MHVAVFPRQGSSWLSYSLYPPISLHHLSSFFKSTQYFLNPQVLTGWDKKKKKRNYEESAYKPLENWFMFPTPLSSVRLPPFHPGPPNTSSRLWICSDMLAWGRKSSKQEGRTPPAPPPPSQRPPEGNHAVSKAKWKGMNHFLSPLQCFFLTEVTPSPLVS